MLRCTAQAPPRSDVDERSILLEETLRALALAIVVECARRGATRLALATPRSAINHPHMQDRWDVTPTADGAAIENPTPYAGYVTGPRGPHPNPDLGREMDDLARNAMDDARLLAATGGP